MGPFRMCARSHHCSCAQADLPHAIAPAIALLLAAQGSALFSLYYAHTSTYGPPLLQPLPLTLQPQTAAANCSVSVVAHK